MHAIERRAAAFHGAGHAVIGRVLRLPCAGAVVAGQPGDQAIIPDPWLALSIWWDADEKYRPVEAAYRATIIGLMAGREAEMAFLGAVLCDQSQDNRYIQRMAEYLCEDGDWTHRRARLSRHAMRLVARHRPRIERVARGLIERGRLQAEEIDAIVLGSARGRGHEASPAGTVAPK
jgi:ATP-dependent Zn protease